MGDRGILVPLDRLYFLSSWLASGRDGVLCQCRSSRRGVLELRNLRLEAFLFLKDITRY